MYIVVTGAAGFIGSNLVKALNARGENRIIAVDDLTKGEQFINLVDCEIAHYMDKEDFLEAIGNGEFDGEIDAILHQGACSDTMEHNGRYMMDNNYQYTLALFDFCQDQDAQFLYASSAAVYGGSETFKEERQYEKPLNVYGYSKFLFDQVVRRRFDRLTAQTVGFRYFNVYGPHEQHKGRMASVAFHHFHQYQSEGKVKLFGGYDGYAQGEQSRDFIFVDDIVKANLYFLDHPEKSGIFNLGTGRAQPFNDIAVSTINRCRHHQGLTPLTLTELIESNLIEYIPFPEALKGKYQSFTQADISALREAGYQNPFASVEEGVNQYVDFLLTR